MEENKEIATTNGMMEVANLNELLEASTKLDKLKPVVGLTSTYIELQSVGDSFKGLFAGFTEINVNDTDTGEVRTLTACRFIINKQMRVNAGAVLVSECKRAGIPIGTPLEVKYERKENKIKIYTLTLLG
jgi:hypothetical protein